MDIATLGIRVDNSQVRAAGDEINKLGAIGSSVQQKLTAAFGALAGVFAVGAVVRKFAAETIAAQDAMAQLEAVVRSTGGTAGRTVAQLDELSKKIQSVTTFSDEAAKSALTMLLAFDKVRGDTLDRAAFAAANLATRMGGDLSSAAQTVGKALQDTERGVALLNRQFRIFSESEVATLKNLQDTGRLAEAQTIILDALAKKFGGAAEAARNTLGGALAGLKNDFGDMFEATTQETGALVSLVNGLGAASRAVSAHRDTLIAIVYAIGGVAAAAGLMTAALAYAPLVAWVAAVRASIAATIFWSQAIGGVQGGLLMLARNLATATGVALAAAAPVLVLAAAFGTLVLWIKNARLESELFNEEIAGAARDARVKQAFDYRRQFGQTKAQEFFPDVLPSKSQAKAKEEADAEMARAKAAQDAIKALREEAEMFGKTAAEARLYKISIADMTDAEKALAVVQANRLSFAEAVLAMEKQQEEQIKLVSQALREQAEAEGAAARAADAGGTGTGGAGDETISVQNRLLTLLGTRQDVADELNRLEDAGHGKALQAIEDRKRLAAIDALVLAARIEQYKIDGLNVEALSNAVDELNAAVNPSAEVGDNWERSARALVAAGQALGGLNNDTALLLQNLISVADQALAISETLATAGGKVASGDWLALVASAAGLLSSIFGGGESPEAKRAREVTQANTDAIRKNTEQRSFAQDASGNALTAAAAAVKALLAVPSVNGGSFGTGLFGPRGGLNTATVDTILAGLGTNLKDLKAQADALGITLNTATGQTFIDSLKQLDLLLKQSALVAFADTFAGKMKALTASFIAFGISDPLTKLIAQLKVAGDLGTITHDAQGRLIRTAGTGSSAINAAGVGLDLATTAGRDQLTTNLQALFTQLQAGTLAAGALGGLTAQEFLDQLTGLIDLVKQAEDAARARTRGLQDLEVRRLRATRQDTAAEDLAFALAQQREYEDAVLSGADALTLATLQEVQRAEALFRSTEAMQGAIDTLQKFSDSLKLDTTLTTLSPAQQLTEAKRQYDVILAAAQGGDAKAAQQLPEAARAFLQASRAVNASGPAYAADFARVVGETDALRQMFQDQKDIQQLIYDVNTATAEHTATLVEVGRDGNAILSEGFGLLVTKQDAMQAQIDELIRQTKIGNEGGLA